LKLHDAAANPGAEQAIGDQGAHHKAAEPNENRAPNLATIPGSEEDEAPEKFFKNI